MRKQIGIVQPLLLAAVIAIGFGTVWAVSISWGVHMAKELVRSAQPFERLNFRTDGTPVIETYTTSGHDENVAYRDLEGNPLSLSREEAWLGNGHLPDSRGVEYDFGYPWGGGFRWNEQMSGYNDGAQPMTYWYFVCAGEPPNSGYFVGFDSVSRQRTGYIGRKGFQPAVPDAEERFPWRHRKITESVVARSQYQPSDCEPSCGYFISSPERIPPRLVYLLANDGVVEVDLLKRSARVVLKESGLLSARQLIRALPTPMTANSAAYLSKVKGYLAVRATDRILILDLAGKLESSFTIPVNLRDARAFMFCLLSDNSAILDVPSPDLRSMTPMAAGHWQLMWIDAKGNILRQKDYTVKRGDFAGRAKYLPWDTAMAVPAPLGIAVMSIVLAPLISISLGEEPAYLGSLGRLCAEFWPAAVGIVLLSAALAWLCYRRQRRFAQPWTGVWVAFVFLAGLPGLVGYLFHRRWPVLEACPTCGRSVPRDRDACAACGAEFPAPQPKGIEVFA
jgi:hypothetical protein